MITTTNPSRDARSDGGAHRALDLHECRPWITPVGTIWLVASQSELLGAFWARPQAAANEGSATHPVFAETTRQLRAYFSGSLRDFDLPLGVSGTPFQRRVWAELRTLSFGSTTSYSEIARRIGAPRAVRAVGNANGKNPFSIIVPCHRVIGDDGSLRGYAGGTSAKAWLLEHEGAKSPS